MTTTELLPAGYIELDGVAMHAAEVRTFTSDYRRFMRLLPAVREINQFEPGTDSWKAKVHELIVSQSVDADELQLTLHELSAMNLAVSDQMKRELEKRNGGSD